MYAVKKNNLKPILAFAACVILLVVSLLVESSFANSIKTEPDYLFKIESSTQSFDLSFRDKTSETASSDFIFNFPTSIKSNQDLSVINSLKDTRYILSKDTVLKTLLSKFDQRRFHTKLETGKVIIDARQTSQSTQTIQVANTFLKPFTNGIYYLSTKDGQTTVGSLQGSFTLGVYDDNGSLASTYLLHRYQEVSFDGSLDPQGVEVDSLSSTSFLDDFRFSEYYNIDKSVLEGELFTLSFKGKTITPNTPSSWQASLNNLNFNQRKKNFLTVYPFYKKLEEAKTALKANNTEQISQILSDAKSIYNNAITESPASQELFKETANQNLQLISGLNPLSKYNLLKVFLADTFSSSLDSVTALKLSLSLLEDINYGYDNSKPDIAVRSEQVLRKVITSSGLKDINPTEKVNLVVVIDNIIDTYPQALTQTLFQARESVVNEILVQTNDQDLVNQFQARKITFLQDIIQGSKNSTIDLEKAKKLSFTIIETLPEDLQGTYRQELNAIDQ